MDIRAVMSLHTRCRNNEALPLSGGILDQPAYLMDFFDVIDSEYSSHRAKESDRQQVEGFRARQLEELERGR